MVDVVPTDTVAHVLVLKYLDRENFFPGGATTPTFASPVIAREGVLRDPVQISITQVNIP